MQYSSLVLYSKAKLQNLVSGGVFNNKYSIQLFYPRVRTVTYWAKVDGISSTDPLWCYFGRQLTLTKKRTTDKYNTNIWYFRFGVDESRR